MKVLRRILRIVLGLFIVLNIMTAFHAWKFTHFYNEGPGFVKKPEQMNGWEKARAMFFGLRYTKSKNEVHPDTAFQTVNFTNADGLNIEAWYMQKAKARGTVILFHGYGASKSKVLEEAGYMCKLGYNTLLVDFRAHGGSDGNASTIGYDEAEEVRLAYEFARNKDHGEIVLWGISLGAAAITHGIYKYGLNPDKVILEMPFGSLHGAVKGRVRMMGLPVQPISALLSFWGGAEQRFWAFGHRPYTYARKINCPVLLQYGRHDPRVTLEETKTIFENLNSHKKKLVIYEMAAHQSLCRKEPVKWRKEVKEFLIGSKEIIN